jgi:hypothetical protein
MPNGRYLGGYAPGYIHPQPANPAAMSTGPVAYGPAYPYPPNQGDGGYVMAGPPMTYPAGQVTPLPPTTVPAAPNSPPRAGHGYSNTATIPAQPASTPNAVTYHGGFHTSYGGDQDSATNDPDQHTPPTTAGAFDPKGCEGPYGYPCHPPAPQVFTTVGVDFIGLRRSEGNNTPIVIDATHCCIGAGDLDFDHELGVRVNMVRDNCCGWGWELGYMGLPSWSGTARAAGNMSLEGPGFQLQVLPADFVVYYDSAFHSAELNLRLTDYCRWSAFAGFHYMRFTDSLYVSELNTPFLGALDIDATNDLYGFHFGADVVLYDRGGPLRIDVGGKIGIYGNDAHHTTGSSFIGPELGCRDALVAYSADAEIRLAYRITNCLEIRAGYQLLGIGGIAYAVDQLHASDFSTGYSSVHYNQLLLDGGHLGVRYCW